MPNDSRPVMNSLPDTLSPGNIHHITNSKTLDPGHQITGNNPQSYIELQIKGKGNFKLTSEELEKWFAEAASSLKFTKPKAASPLKEPPKKAPTNIDPNRTSMQLLSLYGLKSPRDVIAFLHSAAGRTARGMASKFLAEKETQKAILKQEALDRQTKRQRRLAFALLGLAYKKAQAKKSLYELIQRQIDKKLNKNKVKANQAQQKTQRIRGLTPSQINNAYANSNEALQDELQEKNQQLNTLQTELDNIKQQENDIAQRYDTFDEHIAETDAQIEKALGPELTQKDVIESMEHRIARLEEKIAQPSNLEEKSELKSQLMELKTRCEHCKNNDFAISDSDRIEVLQDNLENTEEKLLVSSDKAMQLTAQNRDTDAEASLMTMQALHAQAGNLQDSIDVLKKDKFLYNDAGEKVNLLKDADYILSKDEKLVNENGKSYLLRTTQDISSMTVEEKTQAQDRFEANKTSFLSLKNLVNRNKAVETALCNEKKENATNRYNAVQEEINVMQNQRNSIQANQATIRTEMGNDLTLTNTATTAPSTPSNTNAPTPSPTMASGHHAQSTLAQTPAPTMAKSIPQMSAMNNNDSLNNSGQNFSSVPSTNPTRPNIMKTFGGDGQQNLDSSSMNQARNTLNNAATADPRLQPQMNKNDSNEEVSNKMKESVSAALKTVANSMATEKETPKNTNVKNTPTPFSTRLGPVNGG